MSMYEKPSAKKLAFIRLRAEGYTLKALSDILQKPISTLGDWASDFELEIQTARKEWLSTEFKVTPQDHLSCYAPLLEKIQHSLSQQDFSTVPVKDLFQMLTQLMTNQLTIIKRSNYR